MNADIGAQYHAILAVVKYTPNAKPRGPYAAATGRVKRKTFFTFMLLYTLDESDVDKVRTNIRSLCRILQRYRMRKCSHVYRKLMILLVKIAAYFSHFKILEIKTNVLMRNVPLWADRLQSQS